MATSEATPLILFPGLAADANIFVPQKIAFPQLVVPQWPMPLRGESLDAYCDRLAEKLRPGAEGVIGGASFGGIVALHVAQRVGPRAVLLIGSVRAPDELPRYARWARPFRRLVWLLPVRLLKLLFAPLAMPLARRWAPRLYGLARQFRNCNPAVLKWSLWQLLAWSSKPTVACPVYHIHGNRDIVLPIGRTQPSDFIQSGGHLISLSHAAEVNDFIRRAMSHVR